ncbi:MAG TPA: crosslink repair DNA glycosylase YcaQ family protein, partial [Hyphomicrobiaceae bacterium]|nr:crosslink repair DNA glycosylase YcaQ family protein [Hyphomicrobiaceae bacterium]
MTRRRPDALSLAEARRIAIAAQGAHQSAERGSATRANVGSLIDKLGVLQIDSVNVLARAHTLPIYARLGVYDVADLDDLAYGGRRRRLFEYWGHAASLMPVSLQPLMRWRMDAARTGTGVYAGLVRFAEAHAPLIRDLRREIGERGPSAVGDFEAHANRKAGWWGWSDAKAALEWLFWTGELTTATRRSTFERIYDIPERVLPGPVLAAPTPSEADAKRALIEHAARALGIGTEACLRDYFRLGSAAAKPAIRDLVEAGRLREVTVEGWSASAYIHAD